MRLFVLAAAAVLLSACANSIESRTAPGGGVGLAYMAPMRLLTVTATRAPPAQAQVLIDARRVLVAAENELEGARVALATATSEATLARATAAGAAPAVPALETAAIGKEAVQRVAQIRFDAATVAHARAVAAQEVAVRAATPGTTLRETIEVTMGPAVGDPNTRFVANVNTNWFRSARGRIVVGQNGLLQSANLTVDGQLDEVLVGVAQSIVSLQSGVVGVRDLEGAGDRSLTPRCSATGELLQALTATPTATALSITFDPVSADDRNMVNHALCSAGFSYRINTRGVGRGPVIDRTFVVPAAAAPAVIDQARLDEARQAGIVAGRAQAQAEVLEAARRARDAQRLAASVERVCALTSMTGSYCPGLVYRQNQPMQIDVIRYDNANMSEAYVERSFSFSVPNAAPVDVLRYDDAIFVTRRDDVGFVDGSLVSVDFDRPSEAAVAASIPFRIVRGTTEALSELVQLRVNYTNQQTALTQAEQAAAAAQASGAPSAEVAQLESARRILELRLAVEEARQRLQEAEAQAAASD